MANKTIRYSNEKGQTAVVQCRCISQTTFRERNQHKKDIWLDPIYMKFKIIVLVYGDGRIVVFFVGGNVWEMEREVSGSVVMAYILIRVTIKRYVQFVKIYRTVTGFLYLPECYSSM